MMERYRIPLLVLAALGVALIAYLVLSEPGAPGVDARSGAGSGAILVLILLVAAMARRRRRDRAD